MFYVRDSFRLKGTQISAIIAAGKNLPKGLIKKNKTLFHGFFLS